MWSLERYEAMQGNNDPLRIPANAEELLCSITSLNSGGSESTECRLKLISSD